MPSTRLVPVGGIRHTLAEPGETQVAVRYEVDAASGRVHLTARYAGATDAPTLPAFGLEWTLPKQYENLRFYGLAPEETYHDRLHGGKLGIFERTAAEDNAPYLVPQETGNHEDLRWAEVLDAQGHGMRISQAGSEHFAASLLPYSRSCWKRRPTRTSCRRSVTRSCACWPRKWAWAETIHGARPSMSSTSCPPIAPTRST